MLRSDRARVVVVGHAARDLVLELDGLPDAGGSTGVSRRIERLGGKGANIAVGLRQLDPGATIVLIAALGTDAAGEAAHREARAAGIDVRHVVRRGTTALLVDLVTGAGERRLLEQVTDDSLVTADDVAAAEAVLRRADVVVLQLQQPTQALLPAARIAHAGGARIVLDGAIEGDARDELLSLATAVRADAHEAELLIGHGVDGRAGAERAADELLERGPSIVALSTEGGDIVAWRGGRRFLPHGDAAVADPTGAGDAFVAGLAIGLARGDEPTRIGQLAKAAATSTVQRLGGHPELADVPDEAAAQEAEA